MVFFFIYILTKVNNNEKKVYSRRFHKNINRYEHKNNFFNSVPTRVMSFNSTI